MLTALVLICSVTTTPDIRACNADNAVAVMHPPVEYASAATCMMQGQALVAGTVLGRNLLADERVKVVCVRLERPDRMRRIGAYDRMSLPA